jgi:hypothetical protein
VMVFSLTGLLSVFFDNKVIIFLSFSKIVNIVSIGQFCLLRWWPIEILDFHFWFNRALN